MIALIIVFSFIFAAISIGAQIFISNNLSLKFIDDDSTLNSSKVKIGAIILLILNAYSLIKSTISLFSTYSKDWIAFDMGEELGIAFSRIFSLLIIISYITFGIFLLIEIKRLALLSSASIIIISIFDAIFIKTTTITSGYISLLPSLLVLFSFIIIFTPFRIGHQKIIKASPFLLLVGAIYPVIDVITSDVFSIHSIISIATIILNMIAFILMFNAISPSSASNESSQKATASLTKNKIIIVLSILVFPLVVSLLSLISKIWLFISLILLAIAVPIVIAYIMEKNEPKKMIKYFNNEGKKEIEKMESFMRSNNIPIPTRNDNDDVLYYIKTLFNETLLKYQYLLKKELEQAGYTDSFNLKNVGVIYYNTNSVLIYRDIFFSDIEPSVKNGITYAHTDINGNKQYWSLEEFLGFCKKLEKPNAYQTLATTLSLEDIYWYVEHPTSSGYDLADTASGAIVGGLLLGPVGAIAGAVSSSKTQEKNESEEIEVFWVQESTRYSIAKGKYDANSAVTLLNKHFPNNRSSDRYKKHM